MTENISRALDECDLQILALLQEDCKMGMAEIARRVGKGVSTVHSRIKAMEESGVIRKYTAVLDPTALGRSTLAFIFIRIRYRVPGQRSLVSQREFCENIAKEPLVQGVYIVSGEYDVMLKVRTRDVAEMNSFIVDKLRGIPAVERTLTMFVMDKYLETLEVRGLGDLP